MVEEYKIIWNGKTLIGVEQEGCHGCLWRNNQNNCPTNNNGIVCAMSNNEFRKTLVYKSVIGGALYKIIEVYERETVEGLQYYKKC